MNLPNKITITRIVLSIICIVLLIVPLQKFGIDLPPVEVTAAIRVPVKYIICGCLFLLASVTDFIDGHIARKYNLVTDFGKVMDAVADKILVNGVLIALACNGFISVIIPVVIVSRDIFVDSIKMVVGNKVGAVGASKTGKIKTVFMMTGVTLMLFYNLPFEIWGLKVADLLIMIATVLSVVSGVEYYVNNKKYILEN
ncbi:MAG: CDP-diacylglycerol--glycerol-3-phosphate 3-phosphatidyltransferase [Tenericutes bacterium]|nr:CDP-diacylglycerol--glycerol-3-phosphate 3-phosphatidyltransferase [Mycoplasmatota bacterium]